MSSAPLSLSCALPFKAPANCAVTLCGVRGLGIGRGVTVICGGGYSGKSTLLDALAAGIYDHIGGDGRELVLCDESAVTIAAEDGRSVKRVNVSPFIGWIPGSEPRDFTSAHASGSTSQAANIIEAVDAGARLLFIDEDRSVTNFMIRDRAMQGLIEREPIVPFTSRVRELDRRCGVYTVLVIGGSGEYLAVADRIYMMEDFVLSEVTERARRTAADCGIVPQPAPEPAEWGLDRSIAAATLSTYPTRSHTERMEISETGFIFFGDEAVDTRGIYDFTGAEQLAAACFILRSLSSDIFGSREGGEITKETLACALAKAEREGVESVYSNFFTDCGRFLELPRLQELFALVSRMRQVGFRRETT